MSGLLTSFGTGVSGLTNAQASLNLTAHNLSNAATTGYSRQQTIQTDAFYRVGYGSYANQVDIGFGSTIATIRQVRNEFLDTQYRLQFGRQSFYEAQSETLSEVEDLFGEISGEEFSTSITDLWGALSELQKTPDDIVVRDQLVATASALLEKAQVVQDQVKDYQVNMNTEIKSQVDRINEISVKISEMNQQIRRYEISGQTANDFRDTRNQLLDELSTYISFDQTNEVDGTISIFIEGSYLVTSERSFTMGTARMNDGTDMLKVIWQDNGGGDVFDVNDLTYSTEGNTDVGSLKGLLIARGNDTCDYTDIPVAPNVADYTAADGTVDQTKYQNALYQYNQDLDTYNNTVGQSTLMQVQAQLDRLIHGIVTTVNDILCPNTEITLDDGSTIKVLDEANAPVGDDADKTVGTELFTRRTVERYTKQTVTLADGTTKDVYVYNEEDPSDPYSLYTLDQLKVNEALKQNSSLLPLNAADGSGYVDGFDMSVISKVLDAWGNAELQLDPNSTSKFSFSDYYNQMTGVMATQGSVWNGIVSNQKDLVSSIEDKRQEVMGVSTDEELVSLIKYQHSYNASSRYITVIDQMLEHLINKLG